VACEIVLLSYFFNLQNVFHVSQLKKYVSNQSMN